MTLTEAMPYSTAAPSADRVIEVVARAFNLPPGELKKPSQVGRVREPDVIEARWTAMYVLWRTDGHTLAKIGEALGGRTPAAVSHGFQMIAGRLTFDDYLQSKLAEIRERLGEDSR